jgi:hypothetical protein
MNGIPGQARQLASRQPGAHRIRHLEGEALHALQGHLQDRPQLPMLSWRT